MADLELTGNVNTATGSDGSVAAVSITGSVLQGDTQTAKVSNSGATVQGNVNPAGAVVTGQIAAGAPGQDGLGAGDMLKSTYDPSNKNSNAFSMANMVEGTTNKILTATERTKLTGIEAGATANSPDATLLSRTNHTDTQLASTISDFQTTVSANTDVTANTAVRHSHANKATLDNVTAAYTTAEQTKLAGIASSATANPNAVDGPASGTDMNVARFDGATGKLIQDSLVQIDDTGYIITNSGIESTSIMGAPEGSFDTIGEYTTSAGVTFLNNISAPNLSGSNTGDQTSVTGNAGTATKLATARNINGVAFDGTADITVADSTKVPTTRTVNGHALSANVTVTGDDVLPTQTSNSGKFLTTNGTTSSWATLAGGGDMSASTYDPAAIAQQVVGTTATQVVTNKDLTSATNTFPTLNQNTTGSAATLTTSRTIGTLTGDVTSAGSTFNGSANNTNATVVGKINGVSLAGLATGILKNTTTTGVPSIAVAADFPTLNQNTTGSAATLTTSRTVQTNLASTSTASFNGSANITPGVTGTLPVANGGTGAATLTGILKGTGTTAVTTVTAPSGAIVGDTDTQTLSGKTIAAASNTITGLTNTNLSTTAGDLGGAWGSWTPTWTNLTIGNATQTAKYIQIGKTVHFYVDIVLGTTSSVATNANFSLPVTGASRSGTSTTQPFGVLRYFDTSASATVLGNCYYNSTTTAIMQHYSVSGTLISSAGTTSTAPFTWATGDNIHVQGTYEAA